MKDTNAKKEIDELKAQLAYSKNIGFFFGAGTSTALKIPNIAQLTDQVQSSLGEDEKKTYDKISEDVKDMIIDSRSVNIEDILNQLRRIREITGESKDRHYTEIDGEVAKELDNKICKSIYKILTEKEKDADLTIPKKFFAWLNFQSRDYCKEIFTSNYDLIFEKSLEELQIPFFDGFVGAYEPFFLAENVERFVHNSDITNSWVRLWKIHGSLSWFWKKSTKTKIIRVGKIIDIETEGNEIVIYPSKEKYDSSRKQPFISYFDRLKRFLTRGELVFIISGYSFSDQHINEILFNSLRQNNRLHIIVFAYSNETIEELYKYSSNYLNISAFGPKKGIVSGEVVNWTIDKDEINNDNSKSTYWNQDNEEVILGDFNKLVEFMIYNSRKKGSIEKMANE